MRRFGFVAVVAGLLAATAAGEDTVTLKLYKAKAGDRVRVTKTEKTTSTVAITAMGKAQKKDDTTKKMVVYVDEVITPNPKGEKPLKVTRTYEKFELSNDSGKAEDGPPLNTPITIEKKGEKYEITSGKEIPPGFKARLAGEFEKAGPGGQALLPAKPVKPGDAWKLDGEKLKALLGGGEVGTIDLEKSDVSGKLLKAYQKDGRQYGVVEYTGTIAIKALGGNVPLAVKDGSAMNLKMTLDGCIDGGTLATDMKGTLAIKLGAEGGGVTMSVTADGVITETQELLKK